MNHDIDTALKDRFLAGMSATASTVNVVTTDGAGGRAGVTVSAMSSVSADTPRPTLLVCVNRSSTSAPKLLANGVFCVNILRDDQSYISDVFAGRFRDQIEDKFECAQWHPMTTGSPRVVDPLVAFDCRIVFSNIVGTHHIFFGEVLDVYLASRGSPLIYANRAYGAAERIDSVASVGAARRTADRKLAIGCFSTFGPFVLPALVGRLTRATGDLELTLIEGDQHRVQESLISGTTELALLYDLDLPDELEVETLAELEPYVLLADGHPLARHATVTPEQLQPYPMVLLDAPPSRDYFPSILASAGVTPNIAFRSASLETVRGFVAQGLGYTLLVTKPASTLSYDGKPLLSRPLDAAVNTSRIVLATTKGVELSDAAATLARICRQYFDANTTR